MGVIRNGLVGDDRAENVRIEVGSVVLSDCAEIKINLDKE